MERSLDLILLRGALGSQKGLPTPEELQDLLANAEIGLLLRRPKVDDNLLVTAWYLHGIASVSRAREIYSPARQRQAFLVSAHIFDLALTEQDRTLQQRLSIAFAAAIGYRRGGRDPNATAIMNRSRADIHGDVPLTGHLDTLSLEAGLAFLGFDTKSLFRLLRTWRQQLGRLAEESELPDLSTTVFGPTHLVILGIEDILNYLGRGSHDRFERGIERLRTVTQSEAGPEDLNSRWVAAHILNFAAEARAGSLWNPDVLPPSVTPLVRQGFTVGSPAVLTLWEPQRDLLTGQQSPFDPNVRRMVMAVPTSGGKTLIAQLLAVEHLARTGLSVCYVVPTRSLAREVRQAMTGRVRILQKEAGAELPDFPFMLDFLSNLDLSEETADVEVMTPERLSHLLRHDAGAVLDRFGLFIFDEAQLLKERGRGFILESVIAALDYLTSNTDHQIALISAAMGNAGAIAQWLSPHGNALLHESKWRGPRRLHAVFNTHAHWESTTVEGGAGPVWRYRHTTELSGEIRLRMAAGRTANLQTEDDTGWRLVQKTKDGLKFSPDKIIDNKRSTKHYVIASEMIAALGHAGSVLVVASTKKQAQMLANGLAACCDKNPSLTFLVDFVRQQLGDNHPLVGTLQHGVGFHHAGLPVEVLEALEAAVREDLLPYLTCTSTLTEGVNLPVRTVVLFDQGYPDQPEDSRLRGARLVNAIGRAGRAGKETEGWIVLIRATPASEQDFRDLNPDADSLAVTSSLLSDAALASISQLESEIRSKRDAIFQADDIASDFISFVWLMLSIEEETAAVPEASNIERIVDTTLGANQSPSTRGRLLGIAHATHRQYLGSDPEARLRWARTGTSIGSAQIIDEIAIQVMLKVVENNRELDIQLPSTAILLLEEGIPALLRLNEAPGWIFRISSRGNEIEVDPCSLLSDWMSGDSLSELAEAYLAQAMPASWRIEQMVETVTQQFEHYLSWTIGALVELVNTHLESAGIDERLCPELGGYIRYGVDSLPALQLMASGIRSRRLAHAIVEDLPRSFPATHESLRAWLSTMAIDQWRTKYHASSSEVLDLLDFTRVRRRSLLKALLETGSVNISLAVEEHSDTSNGLSLRSILNEPFPAPIGLYAGDALVATVASEDHAETQSILDTGFATELTVDSTNHPKILRVSLLLDEDSVHRTIF